MRIGDGTAGEERVKSLRFNGLMVWESTKNNHFELRILDLECWIRNDNKPPSPFGGRVGEGGFKQQTMYFHENRHPHTYHARQNAQLGEEVWLWRVYTS